MASSISRWSPTKEQINVLEDLYRGGLQTPSTDQIQQIASNLRAYGHIEGKNVFYWFQNHKARLRQRQRQEPRLYMSRLVRNRPKVPILPASTTNSTTCSDVLGNALCFPQSAIGFYTQLPAAMFPEGVSEIPKISQRTVCLPFPYEYLDPIDGVSDANQYGQANDTNKLQTLELFPLHPTGILGERSEMSSPSSVITSSPLSSETTIQDCV
ncbi:hypothetical protein MRB53_019034 [Persea americana]|uniref:Uncharacterized protein n=1 Tax=Persea americana TaxID=3435 RepID=A0ACC2M9L7_PERAE|nr:hypothetical protein MRB53_019034 [Persea americana]